MEWLKLLLMWVLVVVSGLGATLLGLWVFLQFDISKGWFMALMFILWVGPTLIILRFFEGGGKGGKLWRGTAIEEFAKDADIAKVEPPRCKYCGTTEAPIFVRAHLFRSSRIECPKCHTVTES